MKLVINKTLNWLIIIIIIYLFTAIGLLPGGSGYFTCKQNMKLVINKTLNWLIIIIIIIIYLFTAIGLLPGGSGYSTCKQT